MYPAVFLKHFISAAVILLASLALLVQFSLPYNRDGRVIELYSCILVFLNVFFGVNIWVIIPDVLNSYSVCY